MRWKLTGLIAAIATTLPVLSASAQQPVCGEHETMVERLNGKFSEKRVGAGLGHDGQLVEVFAAPEGTTWSLLVTLPTGKACLVGAGEAWQMPDGLNGKQARVLPQR